MILVIVSRETGSIAFQGEAKATEDFAELNSRYPVEKYKRFVGGLNVCRG